MPVACQIDRELLRMSHTQNSAKRQRKAATSARPFPLARPSCGLKSLPPFAMRACRTRRGWPILAGPVNAPLQAKTTRPALPLQARFGRVNHVQADAFNLQNQTTGISEITP